MPLGTSTSCTFTYTGAAEAWVVPAGVTSAVFAVYGAQGGNFTPLGASPGGSGGMGGAVIAALALTPGATLNMRVGGEGSQGAIAPSPFTVAGGFNGGGSNSCNQPSGGCTMGGAGGGSSDVRTSADALANRLLVAAGGGGAGVGGANTSNRG